MAATDSASRRRESHTCLQTTLSEVNSGLKNPEQYQAAIRNIMHLLSQGRADQAAAACQALLQSNPESNDALLLLGKARQQQGRFDDMLKLVEIAMRRAPDIASLQLQYIGACQFCGHHDRALLQLAKVEQGAHNDPALLQNVAELYMHAGKHEVAHRCYVRAVELDGNNPRYLYNLASSCVAVGELRRPKTCTQR